MNNKLPPHIKGLILDMDGVLWIADQPIGDLDTVFSSFAENGLRVCLATNNATRTPAQCIERLHHFGVKGLKPQQIITSAHALGHELSRQFPEGGEVYLIGELGLRQALSDSGFTVVDEQDFNSAVKICAVAMGMDRDINFNKLRRATLLIRAGVPFYATNPDRTFPTPEGFIPGAGSLLAALVAATDQNPIIVGKPSPCIIQLAREYLETEREETLVVGDRLETDIAGGQAAGCRTALVLSGVSTLEQGLAWRPEVDLIVKDLESLVAEVVNR